jgi:hypothetical protein
LAVTSAVSAEPLTEAQQRQIILRYMYATGQQPQGVALSDLDESITYPEKCGTPAILAFERNRDQMDRRLLSALGVEDATRPTLQAEYGIPGGKVLIHYNLTGEHQVYQATVDRNSNGVPDYVEQLAAIGEYCYAFEIDTLGYTVPLDDSPCLLGGDSRIDIYLQALPFGYYGLTHNQSDCYAISEQNEAAWIIIDHDFQHLPDYVGRPLDAARVTIAHEMFHTIHFAIDATEHVTWFEMSAVWMEEQAYDEVNDYHLYDYVFYNHPRVSLADTTIPGHMYQAAVFPIFIGEKYGRDMIRSVWNEAGALGPGPHYMQAMNYAIDSAGSSPAHIRYECTCLEPGGITCVDSVAVEQSLATALSEFAIWNYFTGPFADLAPDGMGYSEGRYYDQIPLDSMDVRLDYPFRVTLAGNEYKPQANGATYIRLDNLSTILPDSELTFYLSPQQNPAIRWGVAGIFQMRDEPDSHVVVTEAVDVWETWVCTDSVDGVCTDSTLFPIRYVDDILGEWLCTDGQFGNNASCEPTCLDSSSIIDLSQYSSVTIVLTPSSTSTGPFSFGDYTTFGYVSTDTSTVDSTLINLPASILTPYPNPAVLADMETANMTFRFRVPTDSTSFPVVGTARLELEIFAVSGEKVRTIVNVLTGQDRFGPNPGGEFEVTWDMKNGAGNDVASGVYIANIRAFAGSDRNSLLAEDQVKVAVIR